MRSPVAIAFLSVLFGVVGALCIAWAFVTLTSGEYLSTVVVTGFAVFAFGMIAMMAIVAMGRVTPRVTCDDAGITMRPDRRVDGLLTASTIGAFLAMAVYAVFAPLGMLDIPVPRGDQRYFVFACAAGVLVGIFSLRQIITRRGTSYVRITVDSLEMGNTVSSAERSWDEVTDVADRPQNGRQPSGTTYITTADGRTRTLPSDWYMPGGHGLRELVRFYWQHPEKREELIDGRAVERLDTGFGDTE
ncbi:MAG: hypothetical protein QOJ20_130 [Mycobacterium sp.]|jgi:hypothetical protein|nr:hypothetical protein [Mycobacterium sp.]MDT5278935.1 hypothetical protein [Mycobacterium sp.]